jgi:hypothetical protein
MDTLPLPGLQLEDWTIARGPIAVAKRSLQIVLETIRDFPLEMKPTEARQRLKILSEQSWCRPHSRRAISQLMGYGRPHLLGARGGTPVRIHAMWGTLCDWCDYKGCPACAAASNKLDALTMRQRIELLGLHLAAMNGDEVALLVARDWHEEYLRSRVLGIWAPRLEV